MDEQKLCHVLYFSDTLINNYTRGHVKKIHKNSYSHLPDTEITRNIAVIAGDRYAPRVHHAAEGVSERQRDVQCNGGSAGSENDRGEVTDQPAKASLSRGHVPLAQSDWMAGPERAGDSFHG